MTFRRIALLYVFVQLSYYYLSLSFFCPGVHPPGSEPIGMVRMSKHRKIVMIALLVSVVIFIVYTSLPHEYKSDMGKTSKE